MSGRGSSPAPARLSHEAAEALISSRLDGPLDPIDNRSLLAHLATCASCRSFAEQMSTMSRGMRDLPHLPASPAVSRQVRERLHAGQPWWSRLTMGAGGFGAMQAAAMMLILVGAVATVLVLQMIGRDNGKGSTPTVTAATQATTPDANQTVASQASPTETPTQGDAASLTPRPTRTSRPDPTATKINVNVTIPSPTATATETAEPTATETNEPEPTATDTPTDTPTETPTDEPTETPTDEPTSTRTPRPTRTPTDVPPTETPTDEPTETPEATETPVPTKTPTQEPTETPTDEPTVTPTDEPTETPEPTDEPTETPQPTETNTPRPTRTPTDEAVATPEVEPTITSTPRIQPRGTSVDAQGGDNSSQEDATPTDEPTKEPTVKATEHPTLEPTADDSGNPAPTIGPRQTEESLSDGNGSAGSTSITSVGGGNDTGGNQSDGNATAETEVTKPAGNQTDGGETDGNRTAPTPTQEPTTASDDPSDFANAIDLGAFYEGAGAQTGIAVSSIDTLVFSDGATITLADADGNRIDQFPGTTPVWSPLGGVLLYQDNGEVRIWDRDSGQTSSVTTQTASGDEPVVDLPAGWINAQLLFVRTFPNDPGHAEFHSAEWDGTGDTILWEGTLGELIAPPIATDNGVWVVTTDGWVQLTYDGDATDPIANPWGAIRDATTSPYGSVIAFVDGDGVLRVVTSSDPTVGFAEGIRQDGRGYAFSPDGASIVVARETGLRVYDMQTGQAIGRIDGGALSAPGWGSQGIYAVTQGKTPTLLRFSLDLISV